MTSRERLVPDPRLHGPVVPIAPAASIDSLFAARVASTPDAVALIHGDDRLSYGELDLRAEAMAEALSARGIGPGSIVGICLHRSHAQIAALLAVIRLGAAYVPLDPTNPCERISYIVADSGLPIVITDAGLAAAFGFASWLDSAGIGPVDRTTPRAPVDPRSALYVSYTSGSTGNPKGVVGSHRATVSRLNWMARTFPFDPGEVLCLKTPLSFIDSVCEIFQPILGGVPAVIVDAETVADPARMLGLLGRHRVTRLLVVPSLLRAILDCEVDLARTVPDLRMLSVGGEALAPELAMAFRAAAPGVRFLNIYGSSEVAADVTCEVVEDIVEGTVPIGRAIDNVRLYVLDDALDPVPAGESGQLFVGGEAVALGYHRNPERTQARFLPDPFDPEPGARMFQTGDRVCALEDGRLVYQGRVDDQVKVRGHRIELREVEVALAALPGVGQAAAAFHADADGEGHLAAFVTLADGAAGDGPALREAVAARLPHYMVPDWVEIVEAMPLNPNGKLDRRALSARPRPADSRPVIAPATETEARMLRIWTEVLRLPQISTDASYFDLGGNSINAVKVFVRIRKVFGIDSPIAVLLQHQTIRALSAFVDAERASPGLSAAVHPDGVWDTTTVIHPGPAADPQRALFIVGGAGGNVNNLYHLGRLVGRTRPVIGLQTRGVMGHRMLATVEAMAADHITHIRARMPHGPYLLAGYSAGALTALEIARQLERAGETVEKLIVLDAYAPGFDERAVASDRSRGITARIAEEVRGLWTHGPLILAERVAALTAGKLLRGPVLRALRHPMPGVYLQRTMEREWSQVAAPYRGGPVTCPVLLLRGEPMNMRQATVAHVQPLFGWDGFADPGRIEAETVHGDHLRMIEGRGAEMIARALERSLGSAQGRVQASASLGIAPALGGAVTAIDWTLADFWLAALPVV